MEQANQSKPAPQAWRDALRRARAEVAAGQTVESEAIFAEIRADLDAIQADEPMQLDTPLRSASVKYAPTARADRRPS